MCLQNEIFQQDSVADSYTTFKVKYSNRATYRVIVSKYFNDHLFNRIHARSKAHKDQLIIPAVTRAAPYTEDCGQCSAGTAPY